MDSEAVRRRMNMIVAHFAPTIADDISSPAHLLPLVINLSKQLPEAFVFYYTDY